MFRFIAGTFGLLLCAAVASAAAIQPGGNGENLALGKPYTFSLAPNYPLCTDPGDMTDLTDGKMDTNPLPSPQMWELKSTVGWQVADHRPIAITVDLGKVEPISGVTFHSAGGRAGGYYPDYIGVQVSDDGQTFYNVVNLAEASPAPPYGQYSLHMYRADHLNTKGRYVRFVAIPGSMFVFCDELEVYRGDALLLQQPNRGQPVPEGQLIDPMTSAAVNAHRQLQQTQDGVKRRLKADFAAVRSAIEKMSNDQAKSKLLNELDALREPIERQVYPQSIEGFRAVVPVNELDAGILAVYGQMLAHQGYAPLTLWHSARYQLLQVLETPPKQAMAPLSVAMMLNEHRAEVFNLTNASRSSEEVKFSITRLPNGAASVYQVEYVDTTEGLPVASALIPLKADSGQYTTSIPAGMTRQIWLSFDSQYLPAGNSKAEIRIRANGLDQTIPLQLSIAPVRLTDQRLLATMLWDYIVDHLYGITSKNAEAARSDMISHRINAPWAASASAPLPKADDFDSQGNLKGKIDYSRWDAYVHYWPAMRYYMLYPGTRAEDTTFGGLKLGSKECNRAISQWAADWARHNQSIGLKPGQAAVLFIDEPRTPEMFQTTYDLIKPFKEGTDQITILIDPLIHSAAEFQSARKVLELCDIIMPRWDFHHAAGAEVDAMFQQLRKKGKQVGFYMCIGPTHPFDPVYYRIQPWQTFAAGGDISGFWSYGDNGAGNSWNPYIGAGFISYTPIYLDSDSVSGSKHWEALREGIEDYQYLVMLADRQGQDAAQQAAQRVVDKLIRRDSADYMNKGWSNGSHLAETARLGILKQLQQ